MLNVLRFFIPQRRLGVAPRLGQPVEVLAQFEAGRSATLRGGMNPSEVTQRGTVLSEGWLKNYLSTAMEGDVLSLRRAA